MTHKKNVEQDTHSNIFFLLQIEPPKLLPVWINIDSTEILAFTNYTSCHSYMYIILNLLTHVLQY